MKEINFNADRILYVLKCIDRMSITSDDFRGLVRIRSRIALLAGNVNTVKLFYFGTEDFIHDMEGIVLHYGDDGEFRDCFVPRAGFVDDEE